MVFVCADCVQWCDICWLRGAHHRNEAQGLHYDSGWERWAQLVVTVIYLCLRTVKLQSFETTAVQIISAGNGTVLIEGFWVMVIGQIQWNTMKWIMFNVSQYNIHDFIAMRSCLFLFICVSDQGAWWENFIIGLLDRRAMPISFLMRDVSI